MNTQTCHNPRKPRPRPVDHTIPTGYLIVRDYDKGQLETLSIGDYGKAVNVKADFLGYTRPLNGADVQEDKE